MSKKGDNDLVVRRSGNLSRIGLVGTGVYIVVLSATLFTLYKWDWISVTPLELNQVGDLLAGLFGPLAIFWIVLGFFQQGEELRNSVNTLELQAKELALSVEQQRELVEVTRDTLEHERSVVEQNKVLEIDRLKPKPLVMMKTAMIVGTKEHYSLVITNAGSGVAGVKVYLKMAEKTIRSFDFPYWDKGQRIEDGSIFFHAEKIDQELDLSIDYHDNQNARVELLYKLKPPASLLGGGEFISRLVSERRTEV